MLERSPFNLLSADDDPSPFHSDERPSLAALMRAEAAPAEADRLLSLSSPVSSAICACTMCGAIVVPFFMFFAAFGELRFTPVQLLLPLGLVYVWGGAALWHQTGACGPDSWPRALSLLF